MVKIKFVKKGMKAGSKKQQEPRLVGSIIGEMLQGWNRSTELCVDLKTILRSDPVMKTGKTYQGVTRRDDGTLRLNFRPLKTDGHFSVERYALAVYNEICMALYGLVEEE